MNYDKILVYRYTASSEIITTLHVYVNTKKSTAQYKICNGIIRQLNKKVVSEGVIEVLLADMMPDYTLIY